MRWGGVGLALLLASPVAGRADGQLPAHQHAADAPRAQSLPILQQTVLGELSWLAAALREASAGDTVRVPPGVHKGVFVITRRIALVGEPGAILDGGGAGTVLTLFADSVSVSSLEILGSGLSLDHDDAALRVESCEGCSVENVTVRRPLHGIYLANSNRVRLIGNRIYGDAGLAEGQRGNGIHLYNSNANQIARNEIRSTRDGIYFSFASGNSVDSNEVTGVRYGLHYMYSNDNSFTGNSFRRNAAGGAVMFSDRIVLRNNTFSEHTGPRAYGLLLQTTSDVFAIGNRFSGNLIGLFMDNSTRTTFRENAVVGNGIGVDLLPSSRENTLVENWFLGNRTPVRITRGSGSSRWSVEGRGNYWGDRSVFDLDGDGVGDRPFPVGDAYSTLARARPVLELFSGTPAARALSWAEEALPAFRLLRVVDPHPLVGATARGVPARAALSLPSLLTGIAIMVLTVAGLLRNNMRRARRLRGAERRFA